MAVPIEDIIKTLPIAHQRKIAKRSAELMEEEWMRRDLKLARKMTRAKMAKKLGIAQKQISDLEKRTDMHISTLRRSVEALGGKLSLIVEFPGRKPVKLTGIKAKIAKKIA